MPDSTSISQENLPETLGYVSLAGLNRGLIKIQIKIGDKDITGFVGVKKMEGILMGFKRFAYILPFSYFKNPQKETIDSKKLLKEIEDLKNLYDAGKISYTEYLTKSERLRSKLYTARKSENGKNRNKRKP
jgi:hypothetical protein